MCSSDLAGIRATQLPEPNVGSYFLTLFGRSDRVTACACERNGDVTLPQLLHLRNGEELRRQIADENGRLAGLMKLSDNQAVTGRLFLAALNRPPTGRELAAVMDSLAHGPREQVFQDLFWALINSKEFSFNH